MGLFVWIDGGIWTGQPLHSSLFLSVVPSGYSLKMRLCTDGVCVHPRPRRQQIIYIRCGSRDTATSRSKQIKSI